MADLLVFSSPLEVINQILINVYRLVRFVPNARAGVLINLFLTSRSTHLLNLHGNSY